LSLAGLLWLCSCSRPSGEVAVVYCAQDQVYAEPLFRQFEIDTGIKVRAVYDSEAVKTVGIANRLLAERSHPQCDVFWGNEEMRARQLAQEGVFQAGPSGFATFGFRSRRIVINTNRLTLSSSPRSLLELTDAQWKGKIALAYPQFGTTAAHFHALRQLWGPERWESWCRALVASKPLLVDGNSVVVKLVGSGEAWIGLTDSDDVAEGQRNGLPLVPLPVGPETLLIPNTLGLVSKGPHAQAGRKLFAYLQRNEVFEKLIAAHALEGVKTGAFGAGTLEPDWPRLLRELENTTTKLNEIFLR
jgi:iron(III) transport system substrate-binding protein